VRSSLLVGEIGPPAWSQARARQGPIWNADGRHDVVAEPDAATGSVVRGPSALAALRRSIPGVIALRAHEAISDSSIDQVIDDYRHLVGAIELGDERRALRVLDRMFSRSRALARELGLYPDDDRR